MEQYIPGIGFSAGNLMLKWSILDELIYSKKLQFINGEQINIFINFESILYNLTLQKNLHSLINLHKKKVVLELESTILNLIANYRKYFHKLNLNPKIYLYHTSLEHVCQEMKIYNKYYRNYYHNVYMQNPAFNDVGNLLHNIIIPEIKLILSYVDKCYFIESKTFDGSIIPYIISTFSADKNFVISSDVFDTLYLFHTKFILIYIKRRFSNLKVISDIESSVRSIVKDESPFDLTIFNSELYYRLLLSIKGSKIRNISSAKGFGYGKFLKILKEGIDNGIILKDFESIDSIIELFPEKYRNGIKTSFQNTSIETQFSLINDTDIDDIKNQIVDRIDIASLEELNNKRFLEFPINLQGLLY